MRCPSRADNIVRCAHDILGTKSRPAGDALEHRSAVGRRPTTDQTIITPGRRKTERNQPIGPAMAAKDQDAGIVPRAGSPVCSLRNQRRAGRNLLVAGVGGGDVAGGVVRGAHRP
jgi:hypothetical protein